MFWEDFAKGFLQALPDAHDMGMFVACLLVAVMILVGVILVICIAGLLIEKGAKYGVKKTR